MSNPNRPTPPYRPPPGTLEIFLRGSRRRSRGGRQGLGKLEGSDGYRPPEGTYAAVLRDDREAEGAFVVRGKRG
jgi:hypothetical protein